VKHPLQAYFRINAENFGQFERTLIIADERSEVMYMEGCTAPNFTTATLHAAAVELVALPPAKIQYVTVQNQSTTCSTWSQSGDWRWKKRKSSGSFASISPAAWSLTRFRPSSKQVRRSPRGGLQSVVRLHR
jgi:Fe-S cluster assembly scaffold protein SufB